MTKTGQEIQLLLNESQNTY